MRTPLVIVGSMITFLTVIMIWSFHASHVADGSQGSPQGDRFSRLGQQLAVPSILIVGDHQIDHVRQSFDRQLRVQHQAALAVQPGEAMSASNPWRDANLDHFVFIEPTAFLEDQFLDLRATGKQVYLVGQLPETSIKRLTDAGIHRFFAEGNLKEIAEGVAEGVADEIVFTVLEAVEENQPRRQQRELDDYAVWRRLEMRPKAKGISEGDLVLLGDSITEGLSYEGSMLPLVNLGIVGDTTYGLVARSSGYDALVKAGCISVNIGINDLAFRVLPDILHNYRVLLDRLPPNVPVLVYAVFPTDRDRFQPGVEILNPGLRELVSSYRNTKFIDLTEQLGNDQGRLRAPYHTGDGLHLNEAGYGVWRQSLAREISRHCVDQRA